MSGNKETANYGDLEVQITRCMYEIKHDGTNRETDYNISKFVQILVGDEYIKEHRKEHREEEWKAFRQPYAKRVLKVYTDDDDRELLLGINGFSEKYCELGVGSRYKKIADEMGVTTKTVRNKEDKAIVGVVKELLNEIQKNDRYELKLLADEVFAELDGAKPVPSKPPKKEWDKRKFLKWLSGNIVAILIFLAIILHIYLSDFVPNPPKKEEPDEDGSPEIISFSVMNPDICLVPGGQEFIDVDVYPDEANKNRLSTVTENPEIAWTEHLLVNAVEDIQDEDEHLATIIVQTGRIDPAYVNVTVKNPEPVEHYNIGHIGTGTDIDNGGDN